MLAQIHNRGMKLIMDLVFNHTSDRHPWFVQARQSKDNPYRDYFIWKDPKPDGSEPNNWRSCFGGSTWTLDEKTGQYYLHLFAKSQPDLNWENPRVREEMAEVARFWAEKGVDGFRLDVINFISKNLDFPDAPIQNPEEIYQPAGQYFNNGPKFVDYMAEFKEKVIDKYKIFTVGETPGATIEHGKTYTCEEKGILNTIFHFELMDVDTEPNKSKWYSQNYKLVDVKNVMTKWQTGLNTGWNSLYLENHDQPRSISRFGNDGKYRVESAKMLGTWLHLMKGTPFIYQGQEIGIPNTKFESITECNDIETINFFYSELQKGKSQSEILAMLNKKGRDNARIPIPWNALPNAGFTSNGVKPWLKMHPQYKEINVESALRDGNSVFQHYRRLIHLRKEHSILVHGEYHLLLPDSPSLYVYTRTWFGEQVLVITNWKDTEVFLEFSEKDREILRTNYSSTELLISNYDLTDEPLPHWAKPILLRPFEARVYKFVE